MEYQDVTLSLPKEVLEKAKTLAIEEGSSLSGLMTRLLEDLVHDRSINASGRLKGLRATIYRD